MRASTGKNSKKSGSEREENGNVKVHTFLEIEKSVMCFSRAVGNYQQTLLAKRASYTAVVWVAIHFR